MSDLNRRCQGEDGVFLVLWALLLVALLTMVAIVLDLGALRADRREQRSATDAAATAGAAYLDLTPAEACNTALAYAARNLDIPLASFTATGPGCGTWVPCTLTPRSSTYVRGDYTVIITNPVLDTDPLLKADAVGPDIVQGFSGDDGLPCERIGVRITHSRDPIFAKVIGSSGHTTSAHSVARIGPGGPIQEAASLVLLERRDCRAVVTSGNATRLIIASAPGAAGIIQSDSRGDQNCQGQVKVLEGAATLGGPSIVAEHERDASNAIIQRARIGIYAKLFGAPTAHTIWPSTIGEPDPVGFKQVGRTPADERFLENVRALETDATTLVDLTSLPAGFVNATAAPPTGLGLGCNINTIVPIVSLQGSRLWFDCPGGLLVQNLVIDSADAEVVVNGPLTITGNMTVRDSRKLWIRGTTTGNDRGLDINNASLRINNNNLGTCTARFGDDRTAIGTLFVKEGSVSASQSQVQLCQTFMYIRGAHQPTAASFLPAGVTQPPALPPAPASNNSLGSIDVGAGSEVDWTAPNELDDLPEPSDLLVHKYEDLALWTEASATSRLTGGGAMNLGGIFILPNADPFVITGNSPQSIELDAQFYVRKLTVTGNSTLRMVPNPSNQIPITSGKVFLIR